ncbi:uncharacterized protein [Osmerus mordax]|uniref:uncharacterized protein n=1 Tax=Osmerus mordax TaxID=8014 RepID=UPI00350FBA55
MRNGTTLFFAVKAVDKDMLSSETSNLAQVAAALKFPPNKITDLNAELVKDRVLLKWTAPGDDFHQGTASKYDIRYSEDPEVLRSNFNNAHPVNSSNLLPSESGSSEQLSFTPTNGTMRNGTTLFFAVKAVDKDMLSSETSNLAQVAAALKFPPNKITDLNAELVKDRVLLKWTAPGDDFHQGTASKYDIRYSEDPDVLRSNFNNAHPVNSSNLLPSESGSSEQLSFTPSHGTMRNGTTLFFAVKAVDKDMLSSETSNLAQVAAALKFPPNKITDLNAELVKDRVLLKWTAPGDDFHQGTASKYDIRYSEDPDVLRSNFNNAHLINSSNLLPSESGSSEKLSFTPTHGTMRNGTTLFFAVKAVDKDMFSSETSNLAQVAAALKFPPNKITDLNAELVKDRVLLKWTAPGDDFHQGTGENKCLLPRHGFRFGHFAETSDCMSQVPDV